MADLMVVEGLVVEADVGGGNMAERGLGIPKEEIERAASHFGIAPSEVTPKMVEVLPPRCTGLERGTARGLSNEEEQPMNHITIVDPGKSTFKRGEIISQEAFDKENERVSRLGEKPAKGMYFNAEGESVEATYSPNGKPLGSNPGNPGERGERSKLLADIKKSIPDEEMATKEYADMANVAERLGHSGIADTLRSMSDDEARHGRLLKDMLQKL